MQPSVVSMSLTTCMAVPTPMALMNQYWSCGGKQGDKCTEEEPHCLRIAVNTAIPLREWAP